MSASEVGVVTETVAFARQIVDLSDEDRIKLMHSLMKSRQLYRSVHGLNELLADPAHRVTAAAALRKMGMSQSI